MCQERKVNTTLICSIVAIAISLLALCLNAWQTFVTIRPKIALNDFSTYERKLNNAGNLRFGLQFNFQNRGGTEIAFMDMALYTVTKNKMIARMESEVVNPIFPEDTFNKAISMVIPKQFFTPTGENAIKFNENILFKVVTIYPRAWVGYYKQTFYVLWNNNTNRLEHCTEKDKNIINVAISEHESI